MSRPHIVLITADELRKDSLSCYGNQAIKTPHLDQLAGKSIKFERAYTASPWCLPSRCAILTGQYPHNSGAYSNFRKCELSSSIPNLFQILQKNGYQTSVFGKCHFSPVPYNSTKPDMTLPYDEFKNYYQSLGIDHLELQDDKQVSVYFYDDYAKELDQAGYLAAYRQAIWNPENRKVFHFPGPPNWHPDSWVGRKAQEFIASYWEEKPLFSWISFSGPHFPFDPPKEYLEYVDMSKDLPRNLKEGEFNDVNRIHYQSYHGPGGIEGANCALHNASKNHTDEYWDNLRRNYYANVVQIDQYIGKILETIEQKFGDNVLIIFTADHGEMLGNHGIWGKHNCGYEDVLNVPLLVRYPNENLSQSTNAKVMLTDILATCLKVSGIPQLPTNGKDFLENMTEGGYHYVFAEGEGFIAVSDGSLKYVHVNKGGREYYELFDLTKDPHEFDNVIQEPEFQEPLAEFRKQIINLLMGKLLA